MANLKYPRELFTPTLTLFSAGLRRTSQRIPLFAGNLQLQCKYICHPSFDWTGRLQVTCDQTVQDAVTRDYSQREAALDYHFLRPT